MQQWRFFTPIVEPHLMIVYIHMIHLPVWQVKLRSHWLKMTCINKFQSVPHLNHNGMALHDSNCNKDVLHVDIGAGFRHVRSQTLTITRCHFIPVHPLWCFQLYTIITFFSIIKVFVFFAADIQRTKQSRKEPHQNQGQHEKRRKLNIYAENCKHCV